jgi:hypothetical protein
MATANFNTTLGRYQVIDKRATSSAGTATSPISDTTYNGVKSSATLDAALAAANGTYWTTARLDQTCVTDKIHALRMINDAAGIS